MHLLLCKFIIQVLFYNDWLYLLAYVGESQSGSIISWNIIYYNIHILCLMMKNIRDKLDNEIIGKCLLIDQSI